MTARHVVVSLALALAGVMLFTAASLHGVDLMKIAVGYPLIGIAIAIAFAVLLAGLGLAAWAWMGLLLSAGASSVAAANTAFAGVGLSFVLLRLLGSFSGALISDQGAPDAKACP